MSSNIIILTDHYLFHFFLLREWPILYLPVLGHKVNLRGLGICRYQRPLVFWLVKNFLSFLLLTQFLVIGQPCLHVNVWVCGLLSTTELLWKNDEVSLLQLRHSNIKIIQLKTSLFAFLPLKTFGSDHDMNFYYYFKISMIKKCFN